MLNNKTTPSGSDINHSNKQLHNLAKKINLFGGWIVGYRLING